MEREDDADAIFFRSAADGRQNVHFELDVQEGRRLVQDQHLRLLAERPGQHDSLPLSVADFIEILLRNILGMNQLNGLVRLRPVMFRQDAKASGVRIAAHGDHLPAGHPFRMEPLRIHQ